MNWKQIGYGIAVGLLTVALLAGCAKTPQQQESEFSTWSGSSDSRSESSEPGDISLIFDGTYVVAEGLSFRLPDGWEAAQDLESGRLSASSADGTKLVDVAMTPLEQQTGITEQLLAEETAAALAQAWREAGGTQVQYTIGPVSFLGEEHPAVSLSAQKNGLPVEQMQLCLLRAGGMLTITVTARTTGELPRLLAQFTTT